MAKIKMMDFDSMNYYIEVGKAKDYNGSIIVTFDNGLKALYRAMLNGFYTCEAWDI